MREVKVKRYACHAGKMIEREQVPAGVRCYVTGNAYDALRAENERLKAVPMKYKRMEHNAKLQAEVDALRAELAELVAALEQIKGSAGTPEQIWGIAKAALAKHKEQANE